MNNEPLMEFFLIKNQLQIKMIRNTNEGMSTIPGLRQIQFEGFYRFINKGLPEEFDKFPKEEMKDINQNMEFRLFGERYQLLEPLIKERDA